MTDENETTAEITPTHTEQYGRKVTLFLSNLIKLCGLIISINEVFVQERPRTIEILLSVFMMAGAQITEETILAMWRRLFAVEEARK